MTTNKDLFKIEDSELESILTKYNHPYEILSHLQEEIMNFGNRLDDNYQVINGNIWIHKSATVSSSAEIIGPCIIMEKAQVRHNAYIRENVIIGKNSIVGNSCEIKNSLLIGNTQVPHFNYVGDSILGNNTHLGAGVILSNLRLDKQNICLEGVDTKLRKIGAFIGDNVQIGCNSVINPGTIIYPDVLIYPLMNVSGVVKESVTNNKVELRRL